MRGIKAVVMCRCCLECFVEGVFKSSFLVTFYSFDSDSLPVWNCTVASVLSVNSLNRQVENRISQTRSWPGEFFHYRSYSLLSTPCFTLF